MPDFGVAVSPGVTGNARIKMELNQSCIYGITQKCCRCWECILWYVTFSRYPDNIHLQSVKDGRNPYIEVTKSDAEQKLAQEKERHNKKMVGW